MLLEIEVGERAVNAWRNNMVGEVAAALEGNYEGWWYLLNHPKDNLAEALLSLVEYSEV